MDPSGSADERVVEEHALVGVELPALGQRDGADAALLVGELDPVAGAEGAAAAFGAVWR